MLFNLAEQNSVANQFVTELRSVDIQRDRLRFRRNVERLGEILAYEVSKTFEYVPSAVQSPLGISQTNLIKEQPVLLTILRAGFPLLQGVLNFFDHAPCGFIGAYRKEGEEEVTIQLDYVAAPEVEGKVILLIDPMLATGRSAAKALDAIIRIGKPRHVYFLSLIAAPEGITYITKNVKLKHSIFTAAIDERLDENFYIVPGLGDAGDLSYGAKV